MPVREYFKDQLAQAVPLSEGDIAALIESRRASPTYSGDLTKLAEYYNSKLGKRVLFYMVWQGESFSVVRIFEDEFDELSNLNFVRHSGSTPIFN